MCKQAVQSFIAFCVDSAWASESSASLCIQQARHARVGLRQCTSRTSKLPSYLASTQECQECSKQPLVPLAFSGRVKHELQQREEPARRTQQKRSLCGFGSYPEIAPTHYLQCKLQGPTHPGDDPAMEKVALALYSSGVPMT